MLVQFPAQAQKLLIVCTSQEVDEEVGAKAAVGIRRRICHGRHAGLSRGDRVFAGMKDQRGAFGLVEGDYGADEYHVVAAFIAVRGAALKSCSASLEQRNIARSALYREGSELIGPAGGEALREIVLSRRQDMHGEVLRCQERGKAQGMPRQAPQHHGRIQRHGVKAVRGQSDVLARGIAGRDDGDAGCEGAEGAPKLLGAGDGCGTHNFSFAGRFTY